MFEPCDYRWMSGGISLGGGGKSAGTGPRQHIESHSRSWTVTILSDQLRPEEKALKLKLGEIREITASHRPANLVLGPATE